MAFSVVAQIHGGEVVDQVAEFSDSYRQAVLIAIKTPQFQRGIGAAIDAQGFLNFVGDPYGCQDLWNSLKQEILNNFTALGFNQALSELGYSVQIEAESGEISLTALA